MEKEKIELPMHLSHTPIIYVNYEEMDESKDAKFLSVGKATWGEHEDISAKIFRKTDDGRWARQSEELPLWRVLDLAKLVIATITGQRSDLNETAADPLNKEIKQYLDSYINEYGEIYMPKIREIQRLIEQGLCRAQTEKTPNIFSYATSELSQDAMLAWLTKWSDDSNLYQDKGLCKIGKDFVALLTGIKSDEIHSVNVGRQWKNIDVWVEINNDSFLIIEDKTDTTEHSDQLNRYRAIVEEEYKDKRNLFFSYVKTGNEPLHTLRKIQEKGYKTITRGDLLNVLNTYKGKNPLLLDFRSHLQKMEDETQSFKNIPVNKWNSLQWEGFYMELEKHEIDGDWSYVSNPSGGFIGFFWCFTKNDNDKVEMYLQFEQQKLCIKICDENSNSHSATRQKYFDALISESEKLGLPLDRPQRFGSGSYMTIGIVPSQKIFGENIINIESIIGCLKEYERLVKDTICSVCSNSQNSQIY